MEVTRESLPEGISLYRVSAGLGLTSGGEDISIATETRLDPFALRVVAPASLLADLPVEEDEMLPDPGNDPTRYEVGLPLRRYLPEEDEDPIVDLPRVGILVLQPVTVELPGYEAMEDICPSGDCGDGLSDASFDDWQLIVGCRLLYFTWPSYRGSPALNLPAPEEGPVARLQAIGKWRSQLAYAIFDCESQLPAGQFMPWTEFGVAVALVGFDAHWKLLFLDRNSVVRLGGRPRRRSGYHRPEKISLLSSRPTVRPAIVPHFPIFLSSMAFAMTAPTSV